MTRQRVVARIARTLLTTCPPGWHSAQVVCRQVGSRVQARADALVGGQVIELSVLTPTLALFAELRDSAPLWFSARVRLVPPDRFTLDTDDGEPALVPRPHWREVLTDPAVALAPNAPQWVRTAQAIGRSDGHLRAAVAAGGLGPDAVMIADAPGLGWRVLRRGESWVVQHDGVDVSPRLGVVTEAAALALGLALFDVVRADGPISPIADDPPLSLLHTLRPVILTVGTEVDRFGDSTGAVVWAVRTPWDGRSLPDEHARRPYSAFVVLRPIEVLTGVAVPWFGRGGGGTAYVLPASVAALVGDGALRPSV